MFMLDYEINKTKKILYIVFIVESAPWDAFLKADCFYQEVSDFFRRRRKNERSH